MKIPINKIQITNKFQFLNVQNKKRTYIVLLISFLHNIKKCFYLLVIVILYLWFIWYLVLVICDLFDIWCLLFVIYLIFGACYLWFIWYLVLVIC